MEDSFNLSKLIRRHQKQHKNKPMEFSSVACGVKKRIESQLRNRRSSRHLLNDNYRNLTAECLVPVQVTLSKVEHRRQQLEKWKEEKEKQKKEAAMQKKKPFLVGVAKASQKYVPPPPVTKPMPSTSGRVTRSQSAKSKEISKSKESKQINASKSFAPKNAQFHAPEIKNVPKPPKLEIVKKFEKKNNFKNITFNPILPKVEEVIKQAVSTTTKSSNVMISSQNKSAKKQSERTKNKKMKKDNTKTHTSTPKNPVPKSESSSEEKLRSPKSDSIMKTPEQIVEEAVKNSPYVTLSRGKKNATKEMMKKISEGLLDEDASDMDNVQYFRQQLSSEINRITEMCYTWEKISEQNVLPETVLEAILSAVGLARLLMSQKLAQFGRLVEQCAAPQPHQPLVTPADLQGFWDMVYIQVDNVNMRFKNLEELQSRGWEEKKPIEIKKKVVAMKKISKPAAGPSRLREMIAAARKAKQELEAPKPAVQVEGENKSFEGGFFSVSSPIRSPVSRHSLNHTPGSNNSLLKAVLSNEAKKSARKSASFAMLRASVMGKNMEYEGIAPIPQTPVNPVNLQATPGRSILKATNTNPKSERKSVKVVLFNQSDTDEDPPYVTPEKEVQETIENHITITMDDKLDNKENKVNKRRSIIRQDAVDRSPILTRSRRKSGVEDVISTQSSTVGFIVTSQINGAEDDVSAELLVKNEVTPLRSAAKVTSRGSSRRKVLQESVEDAVVDNIKATRKSSRRTVAHETMEIFDQKTQKRRSSKRSSLQSS